MTGLRVAVLLWCTLVIVPCAVEADPTPASIALNNRCNVRFASRTEGAQVLTAKDAFSSRLSKFDLQVRLQTGGEPTTDAWQKSVASQVLEWTDADIRRVTEILDRLREKLVPYRLELPGEVLLIHTTGREEAGAAYTRAGAIVLPPNMLRGNDQALEALLLHELFHVLSRHDRATRERLYRIVGFELGPELELPAAWASRKMTNPDAPVIDCYIKLRVAGEELTAAPLLYATPATFSPQHGTSLFQYLTFRLVVVETRDGRSRVLLKDGEPVLLDPRSLESFHEQIGRNTRYIIHPDEILADNFALLVQRGSNVPTPRILQQMANVLTK